MKQGQVVTLMGQRLGLHEVKYEGIGLLEKGDWEGPTNRLYTPKK
ncbi:hypothetical protein FHS15_005652 [Paenibacillus castaneae]|nr:hypothetical protein [Paenibacillus castaneae]NIK80462.1 hypothetical protein [Paenibacillus castaneae]